MHLAYEIRGIVQPGEPADLIIFAGILFGLLAALILGPVVVFVAMTTRIGGPRRELRFAALRLAGATRLQTAVLAAIETVGAAVAGTLLGWLGFLALRPTVSGFITLGHGVPIFTGDLRVPTGSLLVVLLGVPVLAGATTLVALRPVQLTPVGVRQRARRRPPRTWRLPAAAGVRGFWYSGRLADRADDAAAAGDLDQTNALNTATWPRSRCPAWPWRSWTPRPGRTASVSSSTADQPPGTGGRAHSCALPPAPGRTCAVRISRSACLGAAPPAHGYPPSVQKRCRRSTASALLIVATSESRSPTRVISNCTRSAGSAWAGGSGNPRSGLLPSRAQRQKSGSETWSWSRRMWDQRLGP
jgi:hypothetical protein